MARSTRRKSGACPTCGLRLVIVQSAHGQAVESIEYDVTDWTRGCSHSHLVSPALCPNVAPLIKGWLES